jgi:2-oxoglutarate dehydrogenase E1 component
LFPLPVAQLKEIIAKYPNADDYVWAQEEPKTWVHIFMLMNFNLVKWRLASLKAYSASASGSSKELNVVWQTQYEWFLIKIYLIIRSYF